MKTKPKLTSDERIEFTRAIRTLLITIVRIDLSAKPDPNVSLMGTPFDFDAPVLSRWECTIHAILDEPVRAALKHGIRVLGERLYELTQDTDVMLRISEAASDGPNEGRCAAIVNSAWDGIGDWHA